MWKTYGSSRKRLVLVALAVVVLITVVFGLWYYQLPTDSDILVLDSRALTVILDELPRNEREAVSVAQISVINATGVPKRTFNSYFRLTNVSRTQFQWLLVYNVTGNPDLSVLLVKRISEEEGFRLADEYIVEQVGIDYFTTHFSPRTFDVNTSTVYYTFNYPPSEKKDIELTMWVKLGADRNVIGRHVVTTPQEVTVSLDQAMEIGRENGLQKPLFKSCVSGPGLCTFIYVPLDFHPLKRGRLGAKPYRQRAACVLFVITQVPRKEFYVCGAETLVVQRDLYALAFFYTLLILRYHNESIRLCHAR